MRMTRGREKSDSLGRKKTVRKEWQEGIDEEEIRRYEEKRKEKSERWRKERKRNSQQGDIRGNARGPGQRRHNSSFCFTF